MAVDTFDGNMYDSEGKVFSEQTRDLGSIIRDAIDNKMMDIHTWLPGQVVAFDSEAQTVDVQPEIKRKYTDGKLVQLPVIQNVPVQMPSGMNYSIYLPIQEGDEGILLFCERSLDVWKGDGGIVDPEDSRHHHIADPIFIPGLRPSSNPITPDDPTDLVIQNGEQSKFTLSEDGTIEAKNDSASVTIDPDGSIEGKNDTASISVDATGEVAMKNEAGNVTLDSDGNIAVDGVEVTLGALPAQGVGLGDNIESRLSALENEWTTFITSYNTHTHATAAPGPPSPPLPPASPFTPAVGPAASDTVTVAE